MSALAEQKQISRLISGSGYRPSRQHLSGEEAAALRRRERMEKIDALPADIRELVHEYGATVVFSFLTLGVHKSRHIRHLVETVLNEFSPTRGAYSAQGIRTMHDDEKRT